PYIISSDEEEQDDSFLINVSDNEDEETNTNFNNNFEEDNEILSVYSGDNVNEEPIEFELGEAPIYLNSLTNL
ncbi:16325_t:CDS:2, partial [Funneliformis mosseae]